MFSPIHLAFDLLAYSIAAACMYYFRRFAPGPSPVPGDLRMMYFFVLTNGVIFGSLIFGTLNVMAAGMGPAVGKSIIGALAGGIIAIELFKRVNGIRGSTGAALVPGLALGIFIGRWGCFFGGIDDFTYGIASAPLPGVDFGDGIMRHPVQLYEGFALLVFFAIAAMRLHQANVSWWRNGFYYFVIFYAMQRFAWEFLKPYPSLFVGLNIFQFICLGLCAYGVFMLRRTQEIADAGQVA